MGSIIQGVPGREFLHPEECTSEGRSRTVSFSEDVRRTSIPSTLPNPGQLASIVIRSLPIGIQDSLESAISHLLLAWTLLATRGCFGSIDNDLVINACQTDTSKSIKHLLSELVSDTSEDVKSCRTRIIERFEEFITIPQPFSLSIHQTTQASGITSFCEIDIAIQNGAFDLKVRRRPSEWSTEYVELLLDVLCDLFRFVSDRPEAYIQDTKHAQLHETLQFWKWGSRLAEPIDRPIWSYFAEQASTRPEAEAVVAWDGRFSYAELNLQSNRLARKLQQLGVRAGDAVPLCFEKSVWTVLAVCAVMKAGAAFVLTDPSQPESRLATIFEEVQAKLILTSKRHERLGQLTAPGAKVLSIDAETLTAIEPLSIEPLEEVLASELMYIIFTSGSTGKPKGVMISHSNYTSGAIPRAVIVGYEPDTRVLDFASYAFDVSIDCMLLTLATGGTICVPSDDDRVNNLSGAIRKMNVNMVHTTPSIARVFEPDVIPNLKVLGLGGEAVPAREASEWNKQTRVLIAYGPSECTVGCAFQRWEDGKKYTSLGKGCGGMLWIVDPEDHNKLSPIGAPGELVVEGPIVGPGYINEPEKTAAAFVDNPEWLLSGFAGCKGRTGRLYKTGDLVKYDPDATGAVVFVGRKDQQVKIRGQRVELEEVEHHLRSHLPPKTAVAVEVVNPGGDGDGVLAAFVVEHDLKQEQITQQQCTFSGNLQALLSKMSDELFKDVPKYMVPASYIALSHIPTTVSGKIDRKQLRAIGANLTRKQLASWRSNNDVHDQIRILSDTEQVMSRLWRQVLGYDTDITASDDFFMLGGDSLKAMRLVATARKECVGLTIRTVFTHTTLEDMTKNTTGIALDEEEIPAFTLLDDFCAVDEVITEAAELCDLREDEIEDIYPCTPLQEGLMALSAKASEAYVAQRVLKLDNAQTAQRLKAAFIAASQDCPILRTRIVHIANGGLLQVVLKQSDAWHESQDLDKYLADDRQDAMDLGKPLCRFAVIKSTQGSVDFVLTMHHALYDGWSMPLIVDRVNRVYNDMTVPIRTPFKNFVKWYRGRDQNASGTYWRLLLEDAAAKQFPELPEPGYQTTADSLLEKYVSIANVSASNHTLANVIRGAWVLAVSQYRNQHDIIFGETLTGRNADCPGIEEIESVLITTVPMRVHVSADMTVEAFLRSIHQQTIDRLPHEHFGLQNIRLLSKDTRRACDLRTGLVLHPREDGLNKITEGPATGLVPAGDAEAAQEALKFNSYALMLVCTLDKDGFLTMASFDSNTVVSKDMKKLLDAFARNVSFLMASGDQLLREVLNSSNYTQDGTSYATQEYTPLKTPCHPSELTTEETDMDRASELAQIWSRILKIDTGEIDKNSNFFDLGGDSIGAMKLVSELKRSGYKATVQGVFATKTLRTMTNTLTVSKDTETVVKPSKQPVHMVDADKQSILKADDFRSLLGDRFLDVKTIYPVRPLQNIAVKGTTELPRYSVRYEQIFLSSAVDKDSLLRSCAELVARNEILRTVFVQKEQVCYGIVTDDTLEIVEYSVEGDLEKFCRALCELDVQTIMPQGKNFVKFFFIQAKQGGSCLIFRISHAQYDEMCLPVMLRQLSQLYRGENVEHSLPFSTWVRHTLENNIPASTEYWRDMLRGSKMQKLPGPSQAVIDRTKLTSIMKTVSTTSRPKNVTLASFPTAAWALCLARRLASRDVVFGEVVSGRNTGFDNAEHVTGPCWQYIPFRAQLCEGWAGLDLLEAVQDQHITSSQYEGMGLSEIVKNCTDWDSEVDWFDSVLHQAVAAVESLPFGVEDSRVETYYPHLEPLREWKIQAFVGDNEMTLEVVTFEEWQNFGRELLNDLVAAFEQLVARPEQGILV